MLRRAEQRDAQYVITRDDVSELEGFTALFHSRERAVQCLQALRLAAQVMGSRSVHFTLYEFVNDVLTALEI